MTSYITFSFVTSTIDDVKSFSQLVAVQNVLKSMHFIHKTLPFCSRWRKKDLFIFLIFLCVRIEKNRTGSNLLLNILLSVGQS